MFILKKGHQLGVYVPLSLRALFLVIIFFGRVLNFLDIQILQLLLKGSSWAMTEGRSEITCREGQVIVHNYGIFGQFKNKLATCITHTNWH